MSQTISAVFDGEVLRPLKQPDLPKDASVILEVKEIREQPKNGKKYELADLVGSITWQGDPVIEQRKLRDEW